MWCCVSDGAPELDFLYSLPHATQRETAMGRGCAVWQGDKGILKGDAFGSLPQAAWAGGFGMVMASACDWATRLGTLNSRIPKCSDVAQDSRMCRLVESSKTYNHTGTT